VNGQDGTGATDVSTAAEDGVPRLRLVTPLPDTDLQDTDLPDTGEEELGGDPVCWAHLVCEECGAITAEGHRDWCSR